MLRPYGCGVNAAVREAAELHDLGALGHNDAPVAANNHG